MMIQGTDVEPVFGMQKKYFVKKDYCIEIYIQVCRKEKNDRSENSLWRSFYRYEKCVLSVSAVMPEYHL